MSDKSINLLPTEYEFNNLLASMDKMLSPTMGPKFDQITNADTPKILEKEFDPKFEHKELHFNFFEDLEKQWDDYREKCNTPSQKCKEEVEEPVWNGDLAMNDLDLDEDSLILYQNQKEEEHVPNSQIADELQIHLEIDGLKSQTQPSEASSSPEKKRKTKRKAKTGLRKRKDVVFKALLRKIRSYYWKNFNHITKYNSLKKKESREDLYKECLRTYLQFEFNTESQEIVNEELILTLGDLMTSTGASNSEVNETYLTLYKFSISRLITLCKNPSFMSLIHHFSKIFEGKRLTKDEKKGLNMIIDEGLLSNCL